METLQSLQVLFREHLQARNKNRMRKVRQIYPLRTLFNVTNSLGGLELAKTKGLAKEYGSIELQAP